VFVRDPGLAQRWAELFDRVGGRGHLTVGVGLEACDLAVAAAVGVTNAA